MELITWDKFRKQIAFKISSSYIELTQTNGQHLKVKICYHLENQNKMLLYLDIEGGVIKKFIPLTPEENIFIIRVKDMEELKNFLMEIEEELYFDYSDCEYSDSDIEMVENMNDRVKRVRR